MNPIIPRPQALDVAQTGWHRIQRLLHKGEYQHVAESIQKIKLHTIDEDATTFPLLDALYELCLVGQQCQQETNWHQQALSSTRQREQTLKEQSIALLERIVCSMGGNMCAPKNIVPDNTKDACSHASPHPEDAIESASSSHSTAVSSKNVADFGKQLQELYQEFCHLWQDPSPHRSTGEEADTLEDDERLLRELDRFFDQPAAGKPRPYVAGHRHLPSFQSQPSTAGGSGSQTPPTNLVPPRLESGAPMLHVYCLGSFRVYQDDRLVEPWPSSKGLSIFKYLVVHRTQPIFKEVLMELFWPDSDPEAARNNLNVALHGLRKALHAQRPEFDHVLFENDQYLLNPHMEIWVDVDEFDALYAVGTRHRQAGNMQAAMDAYRNAVPLYLGEFLADDRYVEWLLPRRQQVQQAYLHMLEELSHFYLEQRAYEMCVHLSQKLLEIDSCCEEAHRSIMRCYAEQGQRHLALRQYHHCVESLAIELDIEPDEATQALYEEIRHS